MIRLLERFSQFMTQRKETVHVARIHWDADRADLRAHTVELAAQTVAASSAPEFGGNPERADPEEMFVAALSSCHMLWFLHLAREHRVRVTSYEDKAEGTMDGTGFTRVVLRPQVSFDRYVDDHLSDSWHHGAHERCFIANSVRCPVEVEPQKPRDEARMSSDSGVQAPGRQSSL